MLTMWLQYAYDLLTTCNFGRYLQRNCAAILKKIKILLTICLQFAYICNFCRNIPIFNVDLWLQSCRSLSVTEMKPLHASSLNQCQTKSQRSRRRRRKKDFWKNSISPNSMSMQCMMVVVLQMVPIYFFFIFFFHLELATTNRISCKEHSNIYWACRETERADLAHRQAKPSSHLHHSIYLGIHLHSQKPSWFPSFLNNT